MEIEARQVVANRYDIRKWREKEWWFNNVYDESSGVYLSWFFIRTFPVDNFSLTFIDLKNRKTTNFSRYFILDRDYSPTKLDLTYHSRRWETAFRETDSTNREFQFSNDQFFVDLKVANSTIQTFEKKDYTFDNEYTLFHAYKRPIEGVVRMGKKEYRIHSSISYADHCFGRVPAKTGWHWLAVQNEDICITSLINHGINAQKYTQVWDGNQWIRLNQEVSFEYDRKNILSPWKVTSTELDLDVKVLSHFFKTTEFPPRIPFLGNIDHKEFFVDVNGAVRLDGKWIDVQGLKGVMEEHSGKW